MAKGREQKEEIVQKYFNVKEEATLRPLADKFYAMKLLKNHIIDRYALKGMNS